MDPVPDADADTAPTHREAQQEQPLPPQGEPDPRIQDEDDAGEAPRTAR
jgi:hypothetical protein